jgi:hypothetical protein
VEPEEEERAGVWREGEEGAEDDGSNPCHAAPQLCQYLYFCTRKESKLARSASGVGICTFVLVKQVK